jgi:hypothetical protein
MKKMFSILLSIFLFITVVSPASAGTFSDNFDDGDADGWWLGYSQHTPWGVPANWRVENGELVNDAGGDDVFALVNDLILEDQTIEVDMKINSPSGAAGIVLWFEDDSNWTRLVLYPAVQIIGVTQRVDNNYSSTAYSFIASNHLWYKLKISADSESGNIDVSVDDTHLFTHSLSTSIRSGKSGLMTGNAGGYFDNFVINSDSILDPLTDKDQCKNDGWELYEFRNQGACINSLMRKAK